MDGAVCVARERSLSYVLEHCPESFQQQTKTWIYISNNMRFQPWNQANKIYNANGEGLPGGKRYSYLRMQLGLASQDQGWVECGGEAEVTSFPQPHISYANTVPQNRRIRCTW